MIDTYATEVASNLASALAADEIVSGCIGQRPRVFLNAIGEQEEFDDGRPVILVAPSSDGPVIRGDADTQVLAVVGVDAGAGNEGNPSASYERPDGVFVCSDGGAKLRTLVDATVSCASKALAGAILRNASIEWSLDNGPIQVATITIDYKQLGPF